MNEKPRPRLRDTRAHFGVIKIGENFVHYAVAFILTGIAIGVLIDTTITLLTTNADFISAATTAVNGVLFAIIIMEIMRTVIAHFSEGGLQLQPFLIIGIISAVREILTVGARLSVESKDVLSQLPPHATPTLAEVAAAKHLLLSDQTTAIHNALLELTVNAAVVLILASALVLIRRFGRMDSDRPQPQPQPQPA